jgi:hypothetical protein
MAAHRETGTPTVDAGERIAVDPTLVDAMLALTPEERLRQNDRMLRTIQELRDGFASAGLDHVARAPGEQRR